MTWLIFLLFFLFIIFPYILRLSISAEDFLISVLFIFFLFLFVWIFILCNSVWNCCLLVAHRCRAQWPPTPNNSTGAELNCGHSHRNQSTGEKKQFIRDNKRRKSSRKRHHLARDFTQIGTSVTSLFISFHSGPPFRMCYQHSTYIYNIYQLDGDFLWFSFLFICH